MFEINQTIVKLHFNFTTFILREWHHLTLWHAGNTLVDINQVVFSYLLQSRYSGTEQQGNQVHRPTNRSNKYGEAKAEK